MYLEFQKVQREIEHLSKLYIAYKFVTAQVKSQGILGGKSVSYRIWEVFELIH